MEKIEGIEEYVEKLQHLSTTLKHCDIDELFRDIHSLKALTYHYKYEEISILLEKTENILFFMRNYSCDVKCISEWLTELSKQIHEWVIQIRKGHEPEFYSLFFDEMPLVKCKNYKTPKLNKEVEIVIINKDERVAGLIADVFKTKFAYVNIFDDVQKVISSCTLPGNVVVISSVKYNYGNLLNFLKGVIGTSFNNDNLYVVGNFAEKRDMINLQEQLKLKNIYNLKHSKISDVKDDIVGKFEHLTEMIRIPDNKISLVELSKLVKPLSATMLRLQEQCFGDADIKDIIKTVQSDPMFSGLLLRAINAPFVGLSTRVSSINVAVPLMGTKRVGAMVLVELGKGIFSEDPLDAYGISVEDLISVSQKRAQFIIEWLKYIDMDQKKKENIISIMYLLPIGMILTNQAILHNNDTARFAKIVDIHNPNIAEKILLGYNSIEALEKLCEIWNLPSEVIKVLKAVREHGFQQSTKYLDNYAIIVQLSLQLFSFNGAFAIDKPHIRYAEKHGLQGNDMKNIFLKITGNKIHGNLFKGISNAYHTNEEHHGENRRKS